MTGKQQNKRPKEDPCPCEGCTYTFDCANRHLACGVFYNWIETGKVKDSKKNPSKAFYKLVYGD